MTFREELENMGLEPYHRTEELKEALAMFRKKKAREGRAVKRLRNGPKPVYKRKAKKKAGSARSTQARASRGYGTGEDRTPLDETPAV